MSTTSIPDTPQLAWTLPKAAKIYGLSYEGLLDAANRGLLIVTRPPSRGGRKSWRHVTKKSMDAYMSQYEE